jgi:hypothetical protein
MQRRAVHKAPHVRLFLLKREVVQAPASVTHKSGCAAECLFARDSGRSVEMVATTTL